jgi:hypothetical protein
VSEFTESETSSYFSFSDDEEEAHKQPKAANPLPQSSRDLKNTSKEDAALSIVRDDSLSKDKDTSREETVDTAAALLPRSTKPPILTNRARSTGLPPLNPVLVQQPSQESCFVNRSRTDTGDFTRNSNFTRASGNTNTSRHRRNHDHFSFCSQSISEIYNTNKGGSKKQPLHPPPSVVSFQDRSNAGIAAGGALTRPSALRMSDRGASDVSALGFGDSFDSYHEQCAADVDETGAAQMYGDLLGLGYDEDDHDDDDDDSGSPFAALKKGHQKGQQSRQEEVTKERYELDYLRKCPFLDNAAEGNLVISGWCAVLNLSMDAKAQQYDHCCIPSNHQFDSKDMYYLRATVQSTGHACVLLHRSKGSVEHRLVVDRDWKVESREVNGRMGKAVILRTAKASLLILPVSLDNSFFAPSGELVSAAEFDAIREDLFVPSGCYAPDHQMDAAMFLMFAIDSLVKQCGAW